MDKLTQHLKDGAMEILEVPFPVLDAGKLLVRTHYSVISAGTEGRTVKDARANYLQKARSRQKELKQVLDTARTMGLKKTYDIVMNKLNAPSPLGYSCSGEVIAVGAGVEGFRVGDRVACGGQGAHHADVVSVYKNLCVKIPEGVDMGEAAFATIASIAIQGVRQADLRFGESAVVIGLGLVGQFTVQTLNAAGIEVIGIDIADGQVELARNNGAHLALNRNQSGLVNTVLNHTAGAGADAVIITASSSSLDPIDLAGELARKKGKVIVVGRVPTGFDRAAYYDKELDLRMSTSYGPGRYDPNYEEKGQEYPIAYIRWTETRNMQAYLDMLKHGRISIAPLITHTFPLLEAPDAYQMILDKSEPFAGILLEYDQEKTLDAQVVLQGEMRQDRKVNLGMLGAGSFAQNVLLPAMAGKANMLGIVTANANSARYVADKYKFKYCTDQQNQLFSDEEVNTIFILTRHNKHAPQVLAGLNAGKHVFVEKPLAITAEDLETIRETYQDLEVKPQVMVGFNRRFAPLMQKAMQVLPQGVPRAMNFRINAGQMSADSWIHDPQLGGGRIIGEACHFIDLAQFVAGSRPVQVHAQSIMDADDLKDTAVINMEFENGSVASISYFSNGAKSLSKEYLEIFCDGSAVVIDDFKTLSIHGAKTQKIKGKGQDKGHAAEIDAFIKAVSEGGPAPIPFEELYQTSKATLAVLESIVSKRVVNV